MTDRQSFAELLLEYKDLVIKQITREISDETHDYWQKKINENNKKLLRLYDKATPTEDEILHLAKAIYIKRSAQDCINYNDCYKDNRYIECERWHMHVEYRDCTPKKCKAYEKKQLNKKGGE